MRKPFILLMKLSGPPDKGLNDKLGRVSTEPLRVLMLSPAMISVGVTWDGNAHQLWNALAKERLTGISEVLIVQPGDDWCGMRDRASSGWMTKNCGNPIAWASND